MEDVVLVFSAGVVHLCPDAAGHQEMLQLTMRGSVSELSSGARWSESGP